MTIDELDKVINIKSKENTKPSSKNIPREATSVVRRFISLLISDPSLVEENDKDIAWGDSLDEQLARACITKVLMDQNHNTASIFHFLNNQFDSDFVDEIKSQVLNFDEKINVNDEVNILRNRIKKNKSKVLNKSKLDAIKNKSFDTLSSEEKEFLKTITKR